MNLRGDGAEICAFSDLYAKHEAFAGYDPAAGEHLVVLFGIPGERVGRKAARPACAGLLINVPAFAGEHRLIAFYRPRDHDPVARDDLAAAYLHDVPDDDITLRAPHKPSFADDAEIFFAPRVETLERARCGVLENR